MRRVTLANADVRKALKEQFVCSWFDATEDPEVGISFAHAPQERARRLERANGERNIQVLFLTPKGEVLHAVAGYVKPKDFLAEIAVAQKVYAATLAPGVDRARVVAAIQHIAAADARRRPDAPTWSPESDAVVRARAFVAQRPLLPAAEYRPSMIFGPGRGTFFGVGKSKHGLLGAARTAVLQPPPHATAPPEDRVLAFIRASEAEWATVPVRAPKP